ncbi:MAG: MBL fold metallo-hydrolase [Pseudomonadota bacterium]
MSKTTLTALALCLLASPAAFAHSQPLPAAQTAQPTPVETTDLGDGIYMLQGRGGNIGVLIGEDGAFVIDADYADLAPALLAEIDNIAGDRPRFLLNTHWHGDHTGGNAAMQAAGATIISHEGVRDRLTRDVTRDFFGEEMTTPAAPPEAWPVITFSENMTLYLNGQTIRLIHTPAAHTDGDTFVHFEEADIIHAGDLLFSGLFPFVDVTSGGSFDGFLDGLALIQDMAGEDTRIIAGHGPLSNEGDVADSVAMINGTVAAVGAAMDDGQGLEALLENKVLADWAEDWNWGFIDDEAFTRLIYLDLSDMAGD